MPGCYTVTALKLQSKLQSDIHDNLDLNQIEHESISRSRSVGIPDHASIRLTLLEVLADGHLHQGWDLVSPVAKHFGVTQAARAVTLPGCGNVFDFNVAWAVEDLQKGGLIEIVRSGPLGALVAAFDRLGSKLRITPAGEDLLAAKPLRIDEGHLMRHPAFRAAWEKSHAPASGPDPTDDPVFVLLWGGLSVVAC